MYDDKSIPEGHEDNEYMWSGHKSFPFFFSFGMIIDHLMIVLIVHVTLFLLEPHCGV